MVGCVNRVILIGPISKYGVTLRFWAPTGTPYASFHLWLTKQKPDGTFRSSLVACECWGKRAEAISADLVAGQFVLFEGEVASRKKGEAWEQVISGLDVIPVLAAAVEAEVPA